MLSFSSILLYLTASLEIARSGLPFVSERTQSKEDDNQIFVQSERSFHGQKIHEGGEFFRKGEV